jgi:DNA primase
LIKQQTIQEIQQRIDILDVVGNFIRLKKRGANYLGNCPFHNEKTPSFTVSPSKEIYKCFGCGKSGNAISFVMEHEKYSYVEALRWLANRYNIEIEETELSTEQILEKQTSDSLFIINQFAQQFFTKQLYESEEGKDIALTYLQERGFTNQVINTFQVGFNPVHELSLSKAATEAQFKQDLLQKAGLSVLRNSQLIDNYRGRIIFPIHNISGKILGFGARIIGNTAQGPKYINTPENEIYIKSRLLYGMYFARQPIGNANECLLVEGYTDVISMHQAGVQNVVASGGTALTPEQLQLIKKYTKNLTIIYDGDAAGIKAAMRGLNLALEAGLYVKLVLLPDGDDPDSYARKYGGEAFKQFVQASKQDVVTFQLQIMLKEAGNDSRKKAEAINTIAESISKINKTEDFSRQQDYVKQCASILQIEEAGLHQLVNKFIKENITKQERSTVKHIEEAAHVTSEENEIADDELLALITKVDAQEKAILKSLIEFGHKPWKETQTVADYIIETLTEEDLIEDPEMGLLLKTYMNQYNAFKENVDSKFFTYHENDHIRSLVIDLLEEKYQMSANWEEKEKRIIKKKEDNYLEEVTDNLRYLKIRKIKKMLTANEEEMKILDGEELEVSIKVQLKLMQYLKDLTQQKDIRIIN